MSSACRVDAEGLGSECGCSLGETTDEAIGYYSSWHCSGEFE